MEPVTYSAMPLAKLIDAFSSSDAVPGGGSAAALAGAVGASLLLMVAAVPVPAADADRSMRLADAAARIRPFRDELLALVDRDSDAYGAVVVALRLPKASEAEKAARTLAVQEATRRATEVPLHTMRECRQALHEAIAVAADGSRKAASDVGVAIELLLAGLRGARLNVDANLATMQDAEYKARIGAEAADLERDAMGHAERSRRALRAAS